jgi:uncharacterized membrane-anchored protein
MKLTKDQIQKIVLGAMMFCGVIYAYFEFLLGPQSAGREKALKDAAALEPQISAARAQIAKTKAVEEKGPESQKLLDQVKSMIPDGSPIAWLPTKIADLFKREGIEKANARMLNEVSEKELTGFSKISWAVEVPRGGFLTFAAALSALENEEPLMEVQSFDIEATREDILNQRISFNLLNLVRL